MQRTLLTQEPACLAAKTVNWAASQTMNPRVALCATMLLLTAGAADLHPTPHPPVEEPVSPTHQTELPPSPNASRSDGAESPGGSGTLAAILPVSWLLPLCCPRKGKHLQRTCCDCSKASSASALRGNTLLAGSGSRKSQQLYGENIYHIRTLLIKNVYFLAFEWVINSQGSNPGGTLRTVLRRVIKWP